MIRSLLLCSFFTPATLFAQESIPFCGTDEMHQQIFAEHPEYNAGIVRAHEELQGFTENYINSPHAKSGNPYIIPVVFHIIHDNGPENINDSQVLDAIKQVNIQYRKLNADTSEIVTTFQALAADSEVELRLAQLDPNGNCTSGITRTVSTLTHTGNNDVKALIQWPPDKYLNVYICEQAAGLAGHALLPSAADTIPAWDGIVMQHSYIGTTGTSEYFRRTVLSHEIGHYLNLQHIWGGNNVPDYYYLPVAQGGNCAFDDDVADTPLTIGWQTCNTIGTSCSTLDNVQNYMDYSYCARMFTQGQKDRMHACLNSTVANRNNLWQPNNLLATGTDDITFQLCTANFEVEKKVICAGESINLTDVSRHGVTGRTWTINGGTASSLSDSLVSVTYNTPGTYSISLSVTNGVQSLDTTFTDIIRVLPATGTEEYLVESFENEIQFNENWAILESGSIYDWEINTNTGFNSQQSIYVNNFDAVDTKQYEFISEPIDASNLSDVIISFDYAYSKSDPSINEILKVSVSKDCGTTWLTRRSYLGTGTLISYDTELATPFLPTQNDQWKNDIVTNVPASYLTDGLMVKFRFEALGGNNLFIDNIQILHPDILAVDDYLLGSTMLYPNPTAGQLNIETAKGVVVNSIEIYQINGKHSPANYTLNAGKWDVNI
jgi:PKD repeat protein